MRARIFASAKRLAFILATSLALLSTSSNADTIQRLEKTEFYCSVKSRAELVREDNVKLLKKDRSKRHVQASKRDIARAIKQLTVKRRQLSALLKRTRNKSRARVLANAISINRKQSEAIVRWQELCTRILTTQLLPQLATPTPFPVGTNPPSLFTPSPAATFTIPPAANATSTPTPTPTNTPMPKAAECMDGIDNDQDGFVDYPIDPGCDAPNGDNEAIEVRSEPTEGFAAAAWFPIANSGLAFTYPAFHLDGAFPWLEDMSGKGRAAAVALARQPAGRRVLMSIRLPKHLLSPDLVSDVRDNCASENGASVTNQPCPWRIFSTDTAANKYDQFFQAYTTAGGPPVDALILDYEDFHFPVGDPAWQNAVISDPRYSSGIQDYANGDIRSYPMQFLLGADQDGRPANEVFNPLWSSPLKGLYFLYMTAIKTAFLDDAAFAVARNYFPEINGSDWLNAYIDNRRFYVPDGNGHAYLNHPDSNYPLTQLHLKQHFGDHQATSTYHSLGQITWSVRNIRLDGFHTFTGRPFNSLLYNQNRMRANLLSSSVPLHIWIPSRSYYLDDMKTLGEFDSPPEMFQETIIHAALLNPNRFLLWNYETRTGDSSPVIDSTLREINHLLGSAQRRTLVQNRGCDVNGVSSQGASPIRCLHPWGVDFLLSGIDSGDRRIYRLTPDQDYPDSTQAFEITQVGGGVTVQTRMANIRFDDAVVFSPMGSTTTAGYWIVSRTHAPEPRITYHSTVPFVNAGIDRTITLPRNTLGIAGSAQFRATTSAPAAHIPLIWTQLSGPTRAGLSDPASRNLEVTFPTHGEYSFRISASAGGITRHDDVKVTVLPAE
jgi:hypothetical protein